MRLSHSIELYIAFHASATAFEMSFNADTFKVALVLWHFSKTLSVVWKVLREIFIISMERLNASQYPVSKHCPTVSAMAPASAMVNSICYGPCYGIFGNADKSTASAYYVSRRREITPSTVFWDTETLPLCQFRTTKNHLTRDIWNIMLFSISGICNVAGIFAFVYLHIMQHKNEFWC